MPWCQKKFFRVSVFIVLSFTWNLVTCDFVTYATDDDPYLRMREEEFEAKQRRAEELTRQIQGTQKQIEDERKAVQTSHEKIWREFSATLEIERSGLGDKLSALEERQKLFERELEAKKAQDEVRLNERQSDIKRMMMEMDRLQMELAEDRRVLDERIKELREAKRKEAEEKKKAPKESKRAGGVEIPLENGAVKVATIRGSDAVREGPFEVSQVRPEYYVEIGDVLDLEVWRVPDLTRSMTVRPDGRISLALIGELDVVGRTLVEVKEMIQSKLAEYLRNPQISLSVRQFGGRKFIILGEVGSPGVYRYQQDISLLEGIALAGGFKENARRGKILVIRGDVRKDPQVKIISANVENILKRGMLSENLTILSNDIIYIAKDYLGDYKDILDNLISPTLTQGTDFMVFRSSIRTAQDRRN